ncbi:MAG: hypothetical protein K2H20_02970 [Bacilli bacterium]|nr:hypothetical protein [Bacilli bacterium]
MNRQYFDNLISHLLAIANYAKDIHYNCSGPNFYGDHLFADRFVGDIYEYIDQIKEICLLGHDIKPLHSSEYLAQTSVIIPAGADFSSMRTLMVDTLIIIEQIRDISRGDENLIGAIAQDIQNNVGLLNIMLRGAD